MSTLTRVGLLLILVSFVSFDLAAVMADECPDTQSGKAGFVVERSGSSKTEVFHDGASVRSVMRFRDSVLLETTQYEGLFDLERIDRGRRSVFKPRADLAKLFPLKVGQKKAAEFDMTDDAARLTQRTIILQVQGSDVMTFGPCKYDVLKIERSRSDNAGSPVFMNTDYYAPKLKIIVAKEYKDPEGRTNLIKYDRIYLLSR